MTPDSKLPVESGPGAPPQPTAASNDNNGAWLLNSPPDAPVVRSHGGMQLLLHRTSVFLFVLISAVAGVLLLILPWTPEWTDNYLLLSYPWLRTLISTGFFRGLCSGLGLLDIWIGFWEALHYHDHQ